MLARVGLVYTRADERTRPRARAYLGVSGGRIGTRDVHRCSRSCDGVGSEACVDVVGRLPKLISSGANVAQDPARAAEIRRAPYLPCRVKCHISAVASVRNAVVSWTATSWPGSSWKAANALS
jgi:hypothetical protein